jgi:hypothetical protein
VTSKTILGLRFTIYDCRAGAPSGSRAAERNEANRKPKIVNRKWQAYAP